MQVVLDHIHLPDDGAALLNPALDSLLQLARKEAGTGFPSIGPRLREAHAALGRGEARAAASSFQAVGAVWPHPLVSMAAGVALALASDWRGARAFLSGNADRLESRGLAAAALGSGLNLASIHSILGDPARAESILDRVAQGAGRAGETGLLAAALHDKALLRLRRGRFLEAWQACEKAAAECPGDRPGLARLMGTRGIASQALGEFPRAEEEFRESLSLASGTAPFAELRASVNLAVVCQLTARGGEALDLLAGAGTLAERQGDARFLAKVGFLRALVAAGENPEEAIPAALDCVEQMRGLDYRKGELDAAAMLIPALLESGKTLEAETLAASAVSAAEESGYLAGRLEAMASAALVHLAGADLERARQTAGGVLEESGAAGLPLTAIKALRVLAEVSLQEGEPEGALEHLRRAEGMASEMGAQVVQCHIMDLAAGLLEICGRIEEAEAERAAARARGLSIGIGSPSGVGSPA